MESIKLLGVRVDKVNFDQAYKKFVELFEANGCGSIYTPNPEIILLASENEDFNEAINMADLVVPDGIGVIYASKLLKKGLEERIPGIELMDKILNYCNLTQSSIFLFGGRDGIASKAAENILNKYPNIVIKGFLSGFYEKSDELKLIDQINEAKPDVLFVALGAPKQEMFIHKYKNILNTRIAMGVGGSLDVYSGNSKRAPKIFIKLNIEWLFRLLSSPSRFKRIVFVPKFIIKVIKAYLSEM
jgi:N-acetylglucosaminyldiphosphoundecaprenol N-acetyl-beta-D-mannosaminyltransferase